MTSATLFTAPEEPRADPAPPPLPHAPLPFTRRLELTALPCRTALNRQHGRAAAWFDWSANPYRGCEFGCSYCYARHRHEFPGHARTRDFQEHIYAERGFASALRRDLRARVRPGEHVAFGTATDPYQPLERREGVTRSALRELLHAEGLRLSITTKSDLVVRDADLLTRIARRNSVQVNLSLTTLDRRLARFLEPRAPAPRLRIQALRRLRRAGIHAGVFLMPLLPGITDAERDLRCLVHAAREAGAEYLAGSVVILRGPSRAHFLRELRAAYPRVAARYEVWTRSSSRLPHDEEGLRRVRAAAADFGLPSSLDLAPPAPRMQRQTCFAFAQEEGVVPEP